MTVCLSVVFSVFKSTSWRCLAISCPISCTGCCWHFIYNLTSVRYGQIFLLKKLKHRNISLSYTCAWSYCVWFISASSFKESKWVKKTTLKRLSFVVIVINILFHSCEHVRNWIMMFIITLVLFWCYLYIAVFIYSLNLLLFVFYLNYVFSIIYLCALVLFISFIFLICIFLF